MTAMSNNYGFSSPNGRGNNVKKVTKRDLIDGVCVLAAVVGIAFACCTGCDNKNGGDADKLKKVQQELLDTKAALDNAISDKSALEDDIRVLNDSLNNVSGRLYECEKGKRCIVKGTPKKKPVTKPVVTKPVAKKTAPVDAAVKETGVVIKDDADNNVVKINNGTVNNYYGTSETDAAKKVATDSAKCSCRVVVEHIRIRTR